jgi:hypothetical protein
LNPETPADWSPDIFRFFKYYTRKLIKRYIRDTKRR